MTTGLFKQKHSTVKKKYRNFESRIAKMAKHFCSSNFRQAFQGSPPARIYGQDDVIHSRFYTKYSTCV